MTYGVNAAMNTMQAAGGDTSLDGARVGTGYTQLRH
jgi:hypothetical protein